MRRARLHARSQTGSALNRADGGEREVLAGFATAQRLLPPVALGIALLMGCAEARQYEPPVEMPTNYGSPGDRPTTAIGEGRWWESFGDSALNGFVDEAIEDNLDIEQAWARLEQIEALAVQQGAGHWPQVNAELTAGRARNYDFTGNAQTANQYGVSLAAAYELDLWGRIDATSDAAAFDVVATREDMETITMSVAAQVAEVWFQIVEIRSQLAVLEEQKEVNERLLELVQLRFQNGLASALDVYQQRQQLLTVENQVPLLEARLEVLQHSLALLLGEPPGARSFPERDELPELGELPDAGVPSELLARRPDLRSAHARVQSADRRVAAAVADQFPAIRLSASTGFQAQTLDELIDRWIWSIGTSIVMPIIDGERRAAEVERQQAVLRERLAAYGGTLLRALKEVRDALVSEDKQREQIEKLEEQLEVSRETLRLAQQRYVEGLSDYLPVLTALTTVQRQELSLISARRQRISLRIQLHRALGGSWTSELEDPRPSEDLDAPQREEPAP